MIGLIDKSFSYISSLSNYSWNSSLLNVSIWIINDVPSIPLYSDSEHSLNGIDGDIIFLEEKFELKYSE